MTPKWKAEKLMSDFCDLIPIETSINDTAEEASRKVNNDYRASKNCAIKCVDEILSVAPFKNSQEVEFWQEVKSELEKL